MPLPTFGQPIRAGRRSLKSAINFADEQSSFRSGLMTIRRSGLLPPLRFWTCLILVSAVEKRNANSMTGREAFAAYSRGESLACPVCQALLISIPEVLPPGMSPAVLKCPIDNRHFFVHGEPAGAMKAMRERMKEIAAEDKIKGT